jgi:hypothetical protein
LKNRRGLAIKQALFLFVSPPEEGYQTFFLMLGKPNFLSRYRKFASLSPKMPAVRD